MSIAEPETQAPPLAAPAQPGPLPRRILETFVSPGELFARFDQAPPWFGPVLITALITTLAFAVMPKDVLIEMARSQMSGATPPGQRAPDPAAMVGIMRITGVLAGLFMPFIGAAIVAALLKLVHGAILGGEATYQQYLAVYGHAMLIAALGGVITFPIIVLSGDMSRQLTPALLLGDADPKSFLVKLLMQFGIFSLWQYGVIGIGVGAINRGKLSAGQVWGGVIGLYLLGALLAAAPALLQRG